MQKFKNFICWSTVIFAAMMFSYLLFKPVSLVGSTLITQSNVNSKNLIIKKYFPNEKRDLGQLLLEKSYLKYEILKKNGVFITKDDIINEEKRIDSQTQRPELLQEIKSVFKNDLDEYRKLFVLPNLIDTKIYDYFSNSEQIHQKSLQEAKSIIELLTTNPKLNLDFIAKSNKFEFISRKIMPFLNEAEILGIPADNRKLSQVQEIFKPNPEYNMWADILRQLPEGQVFSKPVNVDDKLFIVRLIKKDFFNLKKLPAVADKKLSYFQFEVEFVVIPKISFEDWLKDQSRTILSLNSKYTL